jgi:hypothetical protein
MVFVSHDTRDAALAEAFSKLLKSVSAGMIKTFRSSDKKGSDGIDFGDEWYKRLMAKLQATSDVVCLFTERSLDRPWILFEAGVAKGKLSSAVVGVALGVPLSRVSSGPFYQFQNMDDSEEDLTKLVQQLARRVPGLELDADVVKGQVQAFKATETEILKAMSAASGKKAAGETAEESSLAKLAEEIKALPSRVAERLSEAGDLPRGRRRRLHPMMLEEVMHMALAGEPGDPVAILMVAGLVRDDLPWLYELAMEVYRAAKSGRPADLERELKRMRRVTEMSRRGPLAMGLDEGSHYMAMEFPRMLEHLVGRILEVKRSKAARRRPTKREPPQPMAVE